MKRMLKLLAFCLLAACFVRSAAAQTPNYYVNPSVTAVPAGTHGFTSGAYILYGPATPTFNVCFYTGYGSSAPIVPTDFIEVDGYYDTFNFTVQATTIQMVPPGSFTSETFSALLYTVPTNVTSCTGAAQANGVSNTIALNYPTLTALSIGSLPDRNPNLKSLVPSNLALTGINFLSQSGSKGNVPSSVEFVAGTSSLGTVKFLSSTSLISTIPLTINPTASSVNVAVCNSAVYSYCSTALTIKLQSLATDIGTLTVTPNPATPSEPVTQTASFGPTAPSVAGAPGGLVTFKDGTTALGTAQLLLNRDATFAAAPASDLGFDTTPIAPIVADFNQDGIPDTLYIEPGSADDNAVFHVQLGTPPAGSFTATSSFNLLQGDSPNYIITSAAVADLNGDGIPDIVVLAFPSDGSTNDQPSLYTLLGNGDGTFQNAFVSYSVTQLYATQLVTGDFNKDGKQDVLVAGYTNDQENVTGLQVLFGNGTGNFKYGPITPASAAFTQSGYKIVAADFNNDGYADVAILNGANASGTIDANVEVYQNDGKGSFDSPKTIPGGTSFLVAPLTTGKPPSVIVTSLGGGFSVYLNTTSWGKISFASTPITTQIYAFEQMVTGDFNGDGNLDAAVIDAEDGLRVFDGNGTGSFALDYKDLAAGESVLPSGVNLIAASDENGDGYADLLFYNTAQDCPGGACFNVLTQYDYITAGTASASFPAQTFAAGAHALSATTAGTVQILGDTAKRTLTINSPPTPRVTLTTTPGSPQRYGVPIELLAVISSSTATGTVSFYNGTTLLGTSKVIGGNVAEATFTPALLAAGTYAFTAVYSGDGTLGLATSGVVPFQITAIPATITWKPNPATLVYGTPLSAAQLDAIATGVGGAPVAGAFTYTPALGKVLTAGIHAVVATFIPTDTNYTESTATQNITVAQATPTVTWNPNPATFPYGTALSAAQLDAVASTPGTFLYTPATGTVLTAGVHTLSVVFTPTDATDFKAVTSTATVTVTQATPTVTWNPNPATFPYGTALSAAQLDAVASTPGSFVYTPATGTVLTAGVHTLSVVFTPTDATDFKAVTSTTTVTVTQATPTVTWNPNPATFPYGTALSAAQLDAVASTPGSFVYTPATGTVLTAGVHTLSVVFTPTDAIDFKTVTSTATVTVTQATPTVTWNPNPATFPYGTALSAAQLDAVASTPGSFVYTPATGTVLTAGVHTLSVVFTPTDATDFKAVTSTATVTVTQATPTVTWNPNPATFPYGTALSAAQLDAVASTPGTFLYTPVIGTVLTAGVHTLSVVFTPTDATDFKAVTSTATVTVTQATPTVTWNPNPATFPYGTALSAAQLDAVASTPGTFLYTPATGTVLTAGVHTLSVVFTPTDATDFKAVTSTTTVTVTQATPTVTWNPNPATFPYGTALSAAQLDAVASTPGSFVYTPATGTVLTAGVHTLSVVFTPTDATDFKAVTSTTTVTVTQATPTVTWNPNPATFPYGTALSAAQLDAVASTPGTFLYTPAIGTVLTAGVHTLSVVFTPTDATDFKAVTSTATVTVTSPTGLTLSATSLVFGNQAYGTISPAQVVTLTNPGSATINISQIISFDEPNPEDFIPTNNCPAALVANASCQVSVTFKPDGVGPKSGYITISDDSTPSTQSIGVSGTGTGGILQVNPGNLKTVAGDGTQGYTGNGGPATAAELNQPDGIAFDSLGDLYIADTFNNVVRKVDTSGNITTVAGTGTAGFSGDGGLATSAELANPFSVTLDQANNLYIQDTRNAVIRKVDANGIITTFAGTPDTEGHSGDGGPATMATLDVNQGARFDSAGNLYVPQCKQASIRKIDTQGIITTVAGNFTEGYTGDGGLATNAQLYCPSGVAIDPTGNFYIADYFNNAIRKVDTKGIITTIAGNGTPGATGDGGLATAATLSLPNDVVLDPAGDLYIADSGNNRIRKIDTTGVITTVAGGLNSAGSAVVNTPYAVTLDAFSNLYFSDSNNNAVREFYPQGTTPFPTTVIGNTAPPQTLTLSNVGNVPIIIPSGGFTMGGDAADFLLSGGTCLKGATLSASGSTCTLQISFTPTAVGMRTLRVSITDNALNSPQFFTIGGTGAPAIPSLTWTPPASIVYGTPLSANQLDAVATGIGGAPVLGTYTYSPGPGTVLTVGMHTLSVVFTSSDPNYTTAAASVPVTVTQATPTVTWNPNPATFPYGTALSAAQLDAVASTPGSFVYTPATGTVLTAGVHTLSVVFTPTDATDFKAVTSTATVTVTQATPTVTWNPNPATFPYGTALSAAQLDAVASTPGSFVYTPATGTVLTAGVHTLSVVFTPNDATDFKAVTSTATVTVTQATPTVTWNPNPAPFPYGTALSAAQLDAVASTPGSFLYTPAIGTVLTAGVHTLSVVFTPTDATDFKAVTSTATVTVTQATPTVTWNPNPATFTYGTALSAAQLDAVASTPGSFVYTPATGTVLTAGVHTLSVVFTPTDATDFKAVTLASSVTVTKATPVLTWATPNGVVIGTALSATQLDATATGVAGSALPGTFIYTPPAGTVLAAGTQKLSVVFTPADTTDYISATASVSIAVANVSLAALSTQTANLGDSPKTITLTGTGFVPSAVVQVNGTPISTTFVNGTTLTAVIPAANFLMVQILQISVVEMNPNVTTNSLSLAVGAPPAAVVFSGPASVVPGTQQPLTFQLTNPYPVPLTATFNLTFTPAAGLADDPMIGFATGGRNFTVVIPANSTATPSLQIQCGTNAGTITVTLALEAGGANVTPASVQPLNIQAPYAVAGITSVTIATNGDTLTVTVRGFSNPRDMSQAKFHFTAASGGSIATPDLTIDVSPSFTTWYASSASAQYGSEFSYVQIFNLTSDASVVGQVSVSLVNSVGVSPEVTSQ